MEPFPASPPSWLPECSKQQWHFFRRCKLVSSNLIEINQLWYPCFNKIPNNQSFTAKIFPDYWWGLSLLPLDLRFLLRNNQKEKWGHPHGSTPTRYCLVQFTSLFGSSIFHLWTSVSNFLPPLMCCAIRNMTVINCDHDWWEMLSSWFVSQIIFSNGTLGSKNTAWEVGEKGIKSHGQCWSIS